MFRVNEIIDGRKVNLAVKSFDSLKDAENYCKDNNGLPGGNVYGIETEDLIVMISDAVENYNDGNFDVDVFDVARELAEDVVEEQENFIHFILSGTEYQLTHTQTTTYPNHKMSFGKYKTVEEEQE
jgi:hypothetical protein